MYFLKIKQIINIKLFNLYYFFRYYKNMKKLIIIFILILNLIEPKLMVYADSSFAICEKNINIYKTSQCTDNFNSIYCIAEKSYYVEIINTTNETYYVNYNGIQGYVKKNEVKEIINTPTTPYPNNVKITIGNDCNLRRTPTSNSDINNIITTIKSGESNIKFIGRIYSKEAIDFGGTLWYYVQYENETGYIYNKYIKSISPIYENTEHPTYKSNLNSKIENPLKSPPSIIIIIVLFIPFILILLILYSPRIFKKNTIKPKKNDEKY